MRGQHEITVRNARVQYKFTVSRNITILRGDSATGKTTLIEMIAAHQRGGERSGVEIRSDKPCVVLAEQNWELMLSAIRDSIVFTNGNVPIDNSASERSIKPFVVGRKNWVRHEVASVNCLAEKTKPAIPLAVA